MYKIFSGERVVMISGKAVGGEGSTVRQIRFQSAEQIREEYRQFTQSSVLKKLIINGDEENIWRVFCSMFVYIEAAGGVVWNSQKELLMIFRNQYWDLPKGKIEKGETPEQSALREVEEECGVGKLEILHPLPNVHHLYVQKGKEFLKRTYWFEMNCKDTSAPSPQQEEGITEVRWMSKNEAKKVADKIYPSLRELLDPIFAF